MRIFRGKIIQVIHFYAVIFGKNKIFILQKYAADGGRSQNYSHFIKFEAFHSIIL